MINKEAIPYSIQIKPIYQVGILGMIFGYGATINPYNLWRRQGLHRNVRCPHCNRELSIAPHTRQGTVMKCILCGELFRFRHSF